MPRLPTIRVMGSHAISTRSLSCSSACVVLGRGIVDVMPVLSCGRGRGYQVRVAPVLSVVPRVRHRGSLSSVRVVIERSRLIVLPYTPTVEVESLAPGGSSMNGMNLSGNPGIVQPMQMPPTLGQPPIPFIQPRLGTLHLTVGPQQPSLTMHFGEPYSSAKSACS